MLIRGTISANMLIKSRYSLNGNSNLESNIFRKDELRTGHNEMTLGAGDQKKVKVVNTSAYGLGPEHHILMEGITMQPSKRSAIAQSVGPITALVALARQRGHQRYKEEWINAVKRSMLIFQTLMI